MVTTMAMSPATAQINCFDRNAYSEPNRSRAITADAENTITSPTNTSSMVTVNSQRSTLTRFAMGNSFHHGDAGSRRRNCGLLIADVDCLGSWSRLQWFYANFLCARTPSENRPDGLANW